ncbi:MAG TPA: amidohydrolase family protein [Allosphingosinicella sp.]|nr:amidohydrolase family protein [Allosphingosinicella sp.]
MFEDIPVVTIEEHFWDSELDAYMQGPAAAIAPHVWTRLLDFEDMRLREMDAFGIDKQVLSLTAPSLQNVPVEEAADLARRSNDKLAAIVARHPSRFDAFAALPTPDPEAAVAELERTVCEMGFKGCMVAGLTHGIFIDDPRYRPLLAACERLRAPLYIHPGWPQDAVVRTWFGDYADKYPLTVRGVWGFTLETATQALRLALSGALDEHPSLNVILGHMGEALPFLLWRVNNTCRHEKKEGRSLRELFTSQFHVTTSGFFSTAALECVIAEMGIDKVMFSIDYPYASVEQAMSWARDLPLDEINRRKILSGNAAALLGLELG